MSGKSEYVLVPREPTLEMLSDGEIAYHLTGVSAELVPTASAHVDYIYRAMVGAAPAAPAPNPSPAAKSGEAVDVAAFEAAYAHANGYSLEALRKQRCWREGSRGYEGLTIDAAWMGWKLALATPSPQPANAVREALLNARKALLSEHWHEKSQLISQIDAALASDPAPAGEAVEPVARCPKPGCGAQKIVGRPCLDWDCPQHTPTPEDTARLREDLERVTRELSEVEGARASLEAALISAERERDDVRKALETANALISVARSCWWSGSLNERAGPLSAVWDQLVVADDAARSASKNGGE